MTDERWLQRLLPRYRYGVILPGIGAMQRGVDYQFYRLAPPDVMQIGVGLGIGGYAAESVQRAMDNFWPCVDRLVKEEADCIVLSGVPVSTQLGRPRVLELKKAVPERTGRPFEATMEAIVAALEFLGARRIALASRFPNDVNESLVAYLREAGIEVGAASSRDLSLSDAQALTLTGGMQLTLDVGREAGRLLPDADAILAPGGAALSLHAIPALEEELGKPVVTNLSAEVWSALIRPGIIPPVDNWGRLLANVSH